MLKFDWTPANSFGVIFCSMSVITSHATLSIPIGRLLPHAESELAQESLQKQHAKCTPGHTLALLEPTSMHFGLPATKNLKEQPWKLQVDRHVMHWE
jgi:hypothetical protein